MILLKRQYFVVKRLVNSFDIVAGVCWWLICILGEAIFGMAAVAPAYSAHHGDSTLLLPSSQSLQYLVVRNISTTIFSTNQRTGLLFRNHPKMMKDSI